MLKLIRENPFTSIVAILTIVSMLSGGVYSMYSMIRMLDQYVTESELKEETDNISIEILSVTIMRYEDDLGRLEIKINMGDATPIEQAEKTNIERRLMELKAKKFALETQAPSQ